MILIILIAVGTGVAFNSLTAGIAAGIVSLGFVRLYSLVRSDLWLWTRGVEYRELVNKKPAGWNPTDAALLKIYANSKVGGDFFPFGVRAIVLQVAYRASGGVRACLCRTVYRCWKYYFFAPGISIATYLIILVLKPGPVANGLLYVAGLLLCLGALAIAVEAALSYFTFGSWSLAYHRFDVAEQRGISEISALAGGVVTALTSNASTMTLAATAFASFDAIDGTAKGNSIFLGLYYTLTAFTGNGDAGPVNWQGYGLMAILYIEAAAYLLIVISLLLDSLGSEPGIHLPWIRR